MFLFVSDSESIDKSTTHSTLKAWGRPEFREIGLGHVVWIDDGFTSCSEHEGACEIRRKLTGIDSQPICNFRSCGDSNRIDLVRHWSGEFVLYYHADRILTVASDLKMFKLLDQPLRNRPKRLEPGREITFRYKNNQWVGRERKVSSFSCRFPFDFDTTVQKVREVVHDRVRALPDGAALLLSGGIDSSAIAAAARNTGKELHAFTLATTKAAEPKKMVDNDRLCARQVAEHLGLPLQEVRITPKRLIDNVPMAVFLSETPRGTIIDESAALIELAKRIRLEGFRHVWTGEAADDLMGGFKFALRYFKGQRLRRYYRQQLERDSPNELAIVQNNFSPWGISAVHPFWADDLMRIGYNLPLRYRIDRQRLMKNVLRQAFREDLPPHIVDRPKCVTRDATGVRAILERAFGTSRESYRTVFNDLFTTKEWPARLVRSLHKSTLN